MNNTPNLDPNKSSSIGYQIEFWCGVVVGYEHQQDQLSNGNDWRYKVRIIGDHSDVDQTDDKNLSYANVLLSTDAGSGAAYKLKSVRIGQGDTVYGIKGPNIPTMIIGVEPRKRSTVLYTEGKFKTLSGFYGDLKKNNILSGEFNEQLGPATPGGKPYTKTKTEREPAIDKLKEIGIDPETETGVIEDIEEKLTPVLKDIIPELEKIWEPGEPLTREKLLDIKEKTYNKVLAATVYLEAVLQSKVQGLVGEETFKRLKADAYRLMNENKLLASNTYTVSGVEYDTDSGLPVDNTQDRVIDGDVVPGGFSDPTTNPDDYYQYDA